jgi:hypothetical protein
MTLGYPNCYDTFRIAAQKFDINLQEIHTQPRKYQQEKKPES